MRIWIDIDNAPHVQIMDPIIRELERRGHKVLITARDYGHTVELLKMKKRLHILIGKHPGKSKFLKIVFLAYRMFKLYIWAFDKKIDLAFSHGSRSMVLPARFLGIPLIVMYDYEYISDFLFRKFARRIFMPSISAVRENEKCIPFPGLKEEIYLWEHKYKSDWDKGIIFSRGNLLVILRPPASMAHYHNPQAEVIFREVLKQISRLNGISGIVIPRTKVQRKEFMQLTRDMDGITVLPKAVDSISMLKDADLLIGGGGTMNREGALLGTPVYSIFQGRIGKVDRWLVERKRMRFINSIEEIKDIHYEKNLQKTPLVNYRNLREYICNLLVHV